MFLRALKGALCSPGKIVLFLFSQTSLKWFNSFFVLSLLFTDGVFGAMMNVKIENDGPVTIQLDSNRGGGGDDDNKGAKGRDSSVSGDH